MKIAGIIAEYNPFHNGHEYHVQETKRLTDAEFIVVVMSGNYVQRGDIAIFDKHTRASAAISCGADLVIELPAVHSMQSAEIFARNAVYILNSLGCINFLSFGAECSDTKKLASIAEFLANESSEYKNILSQKMSSGVSFPVARAQAVKEILGGEYAEILSSPNNILGVEYIKALIKINSSIPPVAVKRHMAMHDEQKAHENIASATYIRDIIKQNGTNASLDYIPMQCGKLYKNSAFHSIEKLETAIVSNLRKMPLDELRLICDVSEGLENRIKEYVFKYDTLEPIIDNIKTKRYTHSRIRRIILNSFLGITANTQAITPQYVKILDFNENGQKILNKIKKSAFLPLTKNTNHVKKTNNPLALSIWEKELLYDSLYELAVKGAKKQQ